MGIFDKLKRGSEETAKPAEASSKSTSKKKEATKKATKPAATSVKGIEIAHKVLLAPVVTEKSLFAQADGKYGFFVAKSANKHAVKQAVKEVYGVMPVSVNIVKRQPTTLTRWGSPSGVKKGSKKAIVTLPKGATIQLTE